MNGPAGDPVMLHHDDLGEIERLLKTSRDPFGRRWSNALKPVSSPATSLVPIGSGGYGSVASFKAMTKQGTVRKYRHAIEVCTINNSQTMTTNERRSC